MFHVLIFWRILKLLIRCWTPWLSVTYNCYWHTEFVASFNPQTKTGFKEFTREKWYFVTKIDLIYYEKKLFYLVIKKNFWNSRLKAGNLQIFWDHWNNLFEQWKVRTIFGNRMVFLTCSWMFLICNKLEQLEFKLEKNIGS